LNVAAVLSPRDSDRRTVAPVGLGVR
jgi:hypothetical protein